MRITTFINLTPHDVSIILASGERLTVEAQPVPARVEQSHTVIAVSDDDTQSGRTVEIAAPVYGEIVGLPAPIPTVAYICSVFVAAAAAAKGRTDVLYPDSGPDAVRDRGQVSAVRRLLQPVAKVGRGIPVRRFPADWDAHGKAACLWLREDAGSGEQPHGTRRDGAFLGFPTPAIWICRMGGSGTYWLLYWDYGYQSWVRDPMPPAYMARINERDGSA